MVESRVDFNCFYFGCFFFVSGEMGKREIFWNEGEDGFLGREEVGDFLEREEGKVTRV